MAARSLDGVAVIRNYVDRIIHNARLGSSTMKVLLLDAATTQTVSAVYSQTEILNQHVYLVTTLGNASQSHLAAVCFLRPTAANVEALANELANRPHYSAYHVFFSGPLPTGLVRKLAEADVHERVVQLQEYYADFLPVNSNLWTLQCRNTLHMTISAGTSWAPQHAVQYERNLQGLSAMLLALKVRPCAIRYAKHSPCAEELAKDLHDAMEADDLFHFRRNRTGGLLVLVLDRRDDPVTPLLSQWTYQAMVHELLGLNNHRVVLKGAPGVTKDLEEVVLSAASDEFFAKNRHKNFGELGEEVQRLLQDYQKQTAQHSAENLNSIEEMQSFMEKFPELKSQSHVVSKHVAIMGELARLVQVCSLMDVSQFEQNLACSDDHSAHWCELLEKLKSPKIKIPDKLRLGLLYCLRYEHSANLHMVQQAMSKGGVPGDMVKLIPVMLRYAGSKSRGPGLFGDQHNLMSRMTKNIVGAVQGVDNVYSQHVPLLMDTVHAALKGKLSPRDYPVVPGSAVAPNNPSLPDEVLVFMVGGITYEEGCKVAEWNGSKERPQVVLAGSTVHNSTSFLDELRATAT